MRRTIAHGSTGLLGERPVVEIRLVAKGNITREHDGVRVRPGEPLSLSGVRGLGTELIVPVLLITK